MSFIPFIKPYPNGYEDFESGGTPVTAAILNTNYDGFLLALNEFLPELEGMVEANPSESATAGNLTKLKVGNSIYLIPSGGSGGSTVEWEQLQLTGTKIATITIDNVPVDVYAPSGGGSGDEVSWTQVLGSGTKIGTITINNTPTDVYAPTPIDVEANPSGTATAGDLTKLKVGNSIYSIPSGGSGGASDLSDLGDVTITNVQNGQTLKWNATTSKWENAEESTGGHTILDDDGTALAQEDDLQFVGVYSEDDPTDEITKVNIYREMTKAEFDLLSADEKKGFIKTTDEPDIASIVDGVFIDTDNVIVSKTSYTPSSFSYTATEDCVLYIEIPAKGGYSTFLEIDGVEVQGVNLSGSNTTNYLISTYLLKKGQTATLSSSSFPSVTPDYAVYGIQQGSKTVDYHEYSTEEKVVGKWIDGKTLYEKTINIPSLAVGENSINHLISGISEVVNVSGKADYSGDCLSLPYSATSLSYVLTVQANATRILFNVANGFNTNNFGNISVTIQYTKSS